MKLEDLSISDMNQEIRSDVLKLMDEKIEIERRIREQTEILQQNGIGMTEPLVDDEGYPISSVDVYQVRHARQRLICLQNDHKDIMRRIENGLIGYYSTSNTRSDTPTAPQVEATEPERTTPFAKVTLVSDRSPAELAGFEVGDEVVKFGSVNSDNFRDITDIATVVQHSEGVEIDVRLKRGFRFVNLVLVPKRWAGRGMLGCSISAL